MSNYRQYGLEPTNSQIINKINSDYSYRYENNIDKYLMEKDNEIMNLCEQNKSLISKIENLKKEKVTQEFQISSLKTDLNSAEIDKNLLIKENKKLSEQIKKLNNILEIKGNKKDEFSPKDDKYVYSLTEKLLLKDKEILNMQEIIYNLKEENKRIFNLEKEIGDKNKVILNLEKHIKNLENQNLVKDTKYQNNYNDNNDADINNDKLISFILAQLKKVELAIDENFGNHNKSFCNYYTSLNSEDSIYDIIKENFYLLINKINNLHNDNYRNKKNIINQLETEKNKNIELSSKKKEFEQGESFDNDKNMMDMDLKANCNSYLDEIDNLNLKIKKLSVLSKKNENLLKVLTDENKDLKRKNYELMKGKLDKNNNDDNNRFDIINNCNNDNSNYGHSTYSDLREKISTMELNNLISLNRKEDNNILDLQNEADELIKENYVGNIYNIKNTNYNNLNKNNNSYIFKNENKKMLFNGEDDNKGEEIIDDNNNNINNELEYDNYDNNYLNNNNENNIEQIYNN